MAACWVDQLQLYLTSSALSVATGAGGACFLYDRSVVRLFRSDGHAWRKKPDGRAVRETHEKLKVSSARLLLGHAAQQQTLSLPRPLTRCLSALVQLLTHVIGSDCQHGASELLLCSDHGGEWRQPPGKPFKLSLLLLLLLGDVLIGIAWNAETQLLADQ